jgi:hypothetical protein
MFCLDVHRLYRYLRSNVTCVAMGLVERPILLAQILKDITFFSVLLRCFSCVEARCLIKTKNFKIKY